MSAHKHAEMIKAKADNMDLVVISKRSNGKWRVVGGWPEWLQNRDYFLCLPQHKKACLHWMNGGDVQLQDFPANSFCDYIDECSPWSDEIWWMSEQCNIRIKPRKEKRWIGFSPKSNIVTGMSFITKESLAEHVNQNFAYPEYVQAIEIEVEV